MVVDSRKRHQMRHLDVLYRLLRDQEVSSSKSSRETAQRFVTEGLGPQPFHGRIVVLINEHTHSAAEMVASFAKQNHHATIEEGPTSQGLRP
jgi:C-terminal processing protease CtpA/Prc